MDPFLRDEIHGWVDDFCQSSRYAALPSAAKERATEVLLSFLTTACGSSDRHPRELEEPDVRDGLLRGVARLSLPDPVRAHVPRLCREFLEELQDQGRMGGGADLGRYVAALRDAYSESSATKPKPLRAVAEKLGRNDPCPCGSGRKYKKCCLGLLDGD